MFPTASLLATLLLAFSVATNPVVVRDNLIRLPFAKQVNLTGASHVLQKDQARAAALRAHGTAKAAGTLAKDAVVSIVVQDQAVTYVASVGVGSPPQTCKQLYPMLFCYISYYRMLISLAIDRHRKL